MHALHWTTVGGAIVALLMMFIPWAWPSMPRVLHFVVWPIVAVGAYYSLQGWMTERAEAGLPALNAPQLIILIGLAIALFGAAWMVSRVFFSEPETFKLPAVATVGNPEVEL